MFLYSDPVSASDVCEHAKSLPRVLEITGLDSTENLISARKSLVGLSGIYALICNVTGAIYIGSSVNLGVRMMDHIINSSNVHLRRAIDKHGVKFFGFIVIEYVEQNPELTQEENKANLLAREQHWLDWLFNLPENFRYNFAPTAGSCLGVTRAKMSVAKQGEKNSMFGVTGDAHPKAGLKGSKPSHTIQISLLNIKTSEVIYFDSQRDAAKFIGVSHNTVQRAMRSNRSLGDYKLSKRVVME
ncbi:hypothetical protein BC937DRAFT_88882 [Endogone sp. FLAS-F59071]|nr:hypothetical protein BC937DRAFT_88882 [Endogone sp. FLAS-F59071]|eukprot:RUS23415.1 hypothetical protein BC937DRAFT_88882 [Endogone sp. FLAS-F59071]